MSSSLASSSLRRGGAGSGGSFRRKNQEQGEDGEGGGGGGGRGGSKKGRGGGGGGEGGEGPTSHWAAARAKMDVSKALAIMGFSSSRTLDHDAKTELNSALAKQMEIIENPRHKERRRRQGARPAAPGMAPPGVEEQIRDDVRMLHEAYQFLSRKFIQPEGARPKTPDPDMQQQQQQQQQQMGWSAMKEEAKKKNSGGGR